MQTQHQCKICPGQPFSEKCKTGGKQWWPLICDPMARVQAMVTTHLGGAAVRPAMGVREIAHQIMVKVKEEHYFQEYAVSVDFKELFQLYNFRALDKSLLSCYCL